MDIIQVTLNNYSVSNLKGLDIMNRKLKKCIQVMTKEEFKLFVLENELCPNEYGLDVDCNAILECDDCWEEALEEVKFKE